MNRRAFLCVAPAIALTPVLAAPLTEDYVFGNDPACGTEIEFLPGEVYSDNRQMMDELAFIQRKLAEAMQIPERYLRS